MASTHRIVVCADDYALSPGVSSSIRDLLASRRLSATSVMTLFPEWAAEATALATVVADIAGGCDVGLHLTLTDHVPLGAMPALATDGRLPSRGALYARAMARRLPLAEIEAELERQLAAFVAIWGHPPSHIDGHHHVHQLPGIRDLVIRAAARAGGGRTWVRVCHEPLGRIVRKGGPAMGKALTIGAFGPATARRARAAGVPINRGFSGVYDLEADTPDLERLFAGFVRGVGTGHLLMCHPGHPDATLASRDAMTTQRAAEHAFLAGPAWPRILAESRVVIGPLDRDLAA